MYVYLYSSPVHTYLLTAEIHIVALLKLVNRIWLHVMIHVSRQSEHPLILIHDCRLLQMMTPYCIANENAKKLVLATISGI